MSRQRPAWCSVSTPVMWSSTTTTSSATPSNWRAKMPTAAEPQPTRMRFSSTPLTIGGAPGLDHHAGAAVDDAFDRLLVAEQLHQLGRHAAFLLAAAGEVVHAAEREHLRAVFGGGDMADHLAAVAHVGLLGAEEAVGVDLHLEAAVAEDAFGDHGHHVDALRLRPHDEGRGLVVGVGGGRAHAGHEDLVGEKEIAAPVGHRLRWPRRTPPLAPALPRAARRAPARALRSSVRGAAAPPDRPAPARPRGWRSGRRRRCAPRRSGTAPGRRCIRPCSCSCARCAAAPGRWPRAIPACPCRAIRLSWCVRSSRASLETGQRDDAAAVAGLPEPRLRRVCSLCSIPYTFMLQSLH